MHTRGSGVDVEAGYEVAERIKNNAARTERAGVMGALGGFWWHVDLSKQVSKHGFDLRYRWCWYCWCLPSSTTNMMWLGKTVAMCVNDITAAGAGSPFYFWTMSQLSKMNQLNQNKWLLVLQKVYKRCSPHRWETAEMPGMYGEDDHDSGWFRSRCCWKSQIIDGSK